MGKDTVVRLKGHITQNQIIEFLSSVGYTAFDKTTKYIEGLKELLHCSYSDYDDSCNAVRIGGFIKLYKDDEINFIYYSYWNVNTFDSIPYYQLDYPDRLDLILMAAMETTFISMNYSKENVQLMKSICEHFGGWIDENDCDNKTYRFIGKKG